MAYKFSSLDDGSGVCVGTLIRFEAVTILVDPAWSHKNVSYEDSVKFWSNIIPDVDIILLSESTTDSLGAFALIYFNFISHFISRVRVYSTLPITNLGRVSTIDFYVDRGILGPYTSNQMDLEDIESAFDAIEAVKFSQLVDLRSRYDGLSMVAYNSGCSPGASIWCITNYSEKLTYARHWNHTKSTILNAAALLDNSGKPLSALFRPSGIITTLDRYGSSKPLKKRTKILSNTLKKGLSNNGSVLIPCEIGGNFLELFAMVHNYLYEKSRNGKYPNIPILLVSYSKGRTVTYAQSMLEWLSSSVLKLWETRDSRSPFDVNDILKLVTPTDLTKYRGSKICFISEVESSITDTLRHLDQTSTTTVVLTSNKKTDINILSSMYEKWDEKMKNTNIEEGTAIDYSSTTEFEIIDLDPLKSKALKEFKKNIDDRRKDRKESEVSLRKELKLSNKYSHHFAENNSVLTNGSDANLTDFEGSVVNDEDDEEDDDNLLDILKGKGKKNERQEIPVDTIITSNSTLKHKIFQFNPKKEKMDEYGTFVDIDQLIPKDDEEPNEVQDKRKRHMDGQDEKESENKSNRQAKKSRQEILKEKQEAEKLKQKRLNFDNITYLDVKSHPCQRTIKSATTTVSCQFTFINMENLVDERSTTAIWPSLKPRKMILVGSEEIQNERVATLLRKREIEIINIPFNKDIEFNTTVKVLDISIDTALDQLLRWQKIGDGHTVAHVVGRLVKESPSQKSPSNRNKLVLKPLKSNNRIQTSGSLSIGDVRLAELRRKLIALNHIAEFKGEGTLVIDGQVAVRKISDGETIIDGNPSEIFDTVKKSVTEMLAKV